MQTRRLLQRNDMNRKHGASSDARYPSLVMPCAQQHCVLFDHRTQTGANEQNAAEVAKLAPTGCSRTAGSAPKPAEWTTNCAKPYRNAPSDEPPNRSTTRRIVQSARSPPAA